MSYLYSLVILLTVAQYGSSLQCYRCTDVVTVNGHMKPNQAGHPNCKNLNNAQDTCHPGQDICYKFILTGPDGSKMITRACGTNEFCNSLNSKPSDGPSTECYTCRKDKCNAASALVVAYTALLVAVAPLALR